MKLVMTKEWRWDKLDAYCYGTSKGVSFNFEVPTKHPHKFVQEKKSSKALNSSETGEVQSKKKDEAINGDKPNIFDEIFKNAESLPKCFIYVEMLPDIPKKQDIYPKVENRSGRCDQSPSHNKLSGFKVKNNWVAKFDQRQSWRRRQRNRNNYQPRNDWKMEKSINRWPPRQPPRRRDIKAHRKAELSKNEVKEYTDGDHLQWVDRFKQLTYNQGSPRKSFGEVPMAPRNTTRYIIEERSNWAKNIMQRNHCDKGKSGESESQYGFIQMDVKGTMEGKYN